MEYRTVAQINLKAIGHNVACIRKIVGKDRKILAAVKANAYGHGDAETAKTAVKCGVDYLGVANIEEAIHLRRADINIPILILGCSFKYEIGDILSYNISPTIADLDFAEALNRKAKEFPNKVAVHVKIDTGMGRIGSHFEHAVDFVKEIAKLENLFLEGIFTHFPSSDEADKSFSLLQIKRFKDILDKLENSGILIPIRHMANSGAILSENIHDSFFDMVRPGLMLYGAYPSPYVSKDIKLEPALTLKTRVVFIKDVKRGSTISYGRTHITKSKARLAAIPVGYGDGYSRLLSNKGEVLIKGKRAPIVGRVCMDQLIVDVSRISEVCVGDEVVLIGKQGRGQISAEEIAEKIGTIPNEVFCMISKRVPRVYGKN
ncbi:alanine racemase [bacterium]|nr:alanine racemase [bacterium]